MCIQKAWTRWHQASFRYRVSQPVTGELPFRIFFRVYGLTYNCNFVPRKDDGRCTLKHQVIIFPLPPSMTKQYSEYHVKEERRCSPLSVHTLSLTLVFVKVLKAALHASDTCVPRLVFVGRRNQHAQQQQQLVLNLVSLLAMFCFFVWTFPWADIFSAMIPQPEGTALIETMRNNDPVQGALVPMNCNKHVGIGDMNQQCLAAVKADRDLVDRLALVRKV